MRSRLVVRNKAYGVDKPFGHAFNYKRARYYGEKNPATGQNGTESVTRRLLILKATWLNRGCKYLTTELSFMSALLAKSTTTK